MARALETRPGSRWLRLGAAALVVAVGACGARPSPRDQVADSSSDPGPPGKLPEASFFQPGEVMEFELSFHNLVVGRAVLAAGEPGALRGRHALVVRSEVRSAGVGKLFKELRDDARTWIDLATGRPLESQSELHLDDKHLEVHNRFHGARIVIHYQLNGKRKHTRRFDVSPDIEVHDSHTALGAIRAWQPRPGERVRFYGLSGRRLWLCNLRFAGRESIRTATGVHPALRIDGIARRLTLRLDIDKKRQPRTFSLWLSEDIHRMPLRVHGHTEYGEVQLEMTRYQRPPRQVDRRSSMETERRRKGPAQLRSRVQKQLNPLLTGGKPMSRADEVSSSPSAP